MNVRLLDRYIFKEVFLACLAAVGFFTFVVMTANVLKDLLSFILAGQLPLESSIKLILFLVPPAAMYALPMGILCGVLVVLGRLSAESEVIAMRACGLSLLRISLPVYVFAALGAAGALFVNFYSMPRARVIYHEELATIVRTNPVKILVPKTFIRDFPGVVVYVNEREGSLLKDFWLWELDSKQRVTNVSHAESGRIDFDEDRNEIVFTPLNGWREPRNVKDPEDFSKPLRSEGWEKGSVRLSLERLFGKRTVQHKNDWLTWTELRTEIARLDQPAPAAEASTRVKDRMKLQIVIQDKFTTAFAVITFALVAVPLGIKVSRRETSANLGVALVLTLAYYFLTVVVKWIDNRPELRPDLWLWGPNIIFLGIGLWLNRRAALA
jgi:lipopolysaccharide export system permease protein